MLFLQIKKENWEGYLQDWRDIIQDRFFTYANDKQIIHYLDALLENEMGGI